MKYNWLGDLMYAYICLEDIQL